MEYRGSTCLEVGVAPRAALVAVVYSQPLTTNRTHLKWAQKSRASGAAYMAMFMANQGRFLFRKSTST